MQNQWKAPDCHGMCDVLRAQAVDKWTLAGHSGTVLTDSSVPLTCLRQRLSFFTELCLVSSCVHNNMAQDRIGRNLQGT
jgi:hypothetical protein